MLRKLFIRFAIPFYHLFGPFFKAAYDFFGMAFLFKFTFNDKKIGIMLNVLRGNRIKIAFAKTEVIDGIQNVGLSHSIITHEAVDDRVKIQSFGIKIFVMD